MEATATAVEVKPKFSVYTPTFDISTPDSKNGRATYGGYEPRIIRDENNNQIALITRHVTWNCQVFSIGGFNNLVYRPDLMDILFDVYWKHAAGKRIMLIDVHTSVAEYFTSKIDKSHIRLKAPYVSTNGSDMTIMMVNLESLFDKRIAEERQRSNRATN